MDVTPLGDQALLITVAAKPGETAFAKVQQVANSLRHRPVAGITEVVPAFTTVGLMLHPQAELESVTAAVRARLVELPVEAEAVPGREREVSVCYEDALGCDLAAVAEQARLTPREVIALHSRARYVVHAIGFLPGFPYLAGLPERLHVPRRATPRLEVEKGSVGIGGAQTGIYPVASPGGWHLIGRTPLVLFEPRADPPAWLQPGDRVIFRPIDREEFVRLETAAREARRALLADTHPPFQASAAIAVLRPGIQTTVQDAGRPGWLAQGVPGSGAMDPLALHCANLLVGNAPEAAGLEWVLRGPVLRFARDSVVALMGATPTGAPKGKPHRVRAGDTLDLTEICGGVRGYLAIAGGIEVPPLLGSRSTYLRGGFGGFRGRALRAGDALPVGETATPVRLDGWSLAPHLMPAPGDETELRVVRGPQADRFGLDAWGTLTQQPFQLRAESDRMGARLDGPRLTPLEAQEQVSAPVATGAVQVPPDGHPIVLLADRQSLGGYPQIAYVIAVDWPRLAQVRPGDRVRFREVSLEEAQHGRLRRMRDLGLLALGVANLVQRCKST